MIKLIEENSFKALKVTLANIMVKKIFPCLCAVILCNFILLLYTQKAPNASSEKYPFSLYGNEIKFDVFREGKKVGFHHVKFSKQNTNLLVKSEFKIKIDFLFLTAFSFYYKCDAIWKDGYLTKINILVNDDGEKFSFEAIKKKNQMFMVGANEPLIADLPLFPTNHWNAQVLDKKTLLNTLTGEINNVLISPFSKEKVMTENGQVLATRYVYSGDLDTEVWYDTKGRWVKMEFKGRDDSTISYKCVKCQGPRRG